jgi:hypothetical protein
MALPNYLVPYPASGNGEQPRPVPTSVMTRVLNVASTAESITVPSGARRVIFGYTSNTYVNCYTTAAVPAADITDGTGSELNPSSYLLPSDVTTISVVSAVLNAVVVASFYA